MNFTESLLTALDSLRANTLRSILTMLGVIIGVGAVIGLVSIGDGVQESITADIEAIGSNLLTIFTDGDNSGGYPALTLGDVEALANPYDAPSIDTVSASINRNESVIYGNGDLQASVSGVTANYLTVNNLTEFLAGDGLYQPDVDTAARTAVIGSQVAAELFGEEFPIGQEVRIRGVGYEVVGVLEEQGQGFGSNPDETVFIPITTAQQRLGVQRTRRGEKAVDRIVAAAVTDEVTEQAMEELTEILRERHGISYSSEDDFRILSNATILDTIGTITGALTLFLGAIAGISLVVGGIGIMNIMLVSVTERTREIGIRKAIGALRRDILMQFLLESVVLSLVGGGIGIGLGYGLAALATAIGDIPTSVTLDTIGLATGISMTIGLVFGIFPAWRAASLRPIEALRYE
ncbi:MAG: putative ABC transport system permease protein [Cellvibrionaceae bacterium]|jgi:putative ABC transport system permease protein